MQILTECLKQLISGWHIAFRLSWIWFAIYVVIPHWGIKNTTQLIPHDGGNGEAHLEMVSGAEFFLSFIVFVIIFSVGTISIAIGWHRHILLNEVPSRFHLISSNFPMLAYFLMWLQIAFMVIFFWILAGLVLFSIQGLMDGTTVSVSPPTIKNVVVFYASEFVVGVVITWITLRLSLALPAIAVGKEMRMGESFNLTRKLRLELLLIAAILFLIQSSPALLDLIFRQKLSLPDPLHLYVWILAESFVF